MRIVVTGGLGHIGSQLIRCIHRHIPTVEVAVVDNLHTQRYVSWFGLPDYPIHLVEGDVRVKSVMEPLIQESTAVIHLAALTDAEASFDVASTYMMVNFGGTSLIAQLCAQNNVPIVYASTTSVYGPQEGMLVEGSPVKPNSPYAESKLAGEETLRMTGNDLSYVILRMGTIYGISPGMRFHTAVNKFCWQAAQGHPITVWREASHSERPYLWLGDAMRALTWAVIGRLGWRETYNVVTCNKVPLAIVRALQEVKPWLRTEFVDAPITNQQSYKVSSEKIKGRGLALSGKNFDQQVQKTLRMLMPGALS